MKNKLLILNIVFLLTSLNTRAQLNWNESGYSTIKGTILNFEKHYSEYNTVEIQIDDWTNAYRRSVFTEIDSNGCFSLSFFIFQTQEILFFYKNEWRYIFVTPNDTINVTINGDTFRKTCNLLPMDSSNYSFADSGFHYGIKYEGFTEKINQNYIHYSNSINKPPHRGIYFGIDETTTSLSYENYKEWRDSIYSIQDSVLNNFIKRNQYEEYFKDFLQSRYYLTYLYDLFNYYSMLGNHYKQYDSIRNSDILEIINSEEIQCNDKLYANSESYFTIINNHLYGVISDLGNQEFRKGYNNVAQLSDIAEERRKLTPLKDLSPSEYSIAQYPYMLEAADTIISITIRETLIAHLYTMLLNNKSIDSGLDITLSRISNENIRASVINAYNHFVWKESNQNAISPYGDTLLNYLKTKYKDHVLYIDFWGTWCGPCYESFMAVPALKDRLNGEKIAFIYLCCHCDKEKWEQDILTYDIKGEHLFLSSEQYAYLASKFNIIGVPRYLIIDANGKIVNNSAPRPVNHPVYLDFLVKELHKYLKN